MLQRLCTTCCVCRLVVMFPKTKIYVHGFRRFVCCMCGTTAVALGYFRTLIHFGKYTTSTSNEYSLVAAAATTAVRLFRLSLPARFAFVDTGRRACARYTCAAGRSTRKSLVISVGIEM